MMALHVVMILIVLHRLASIRCVLSVIIILLDNIVIIMHVQLIMIVLLKLVPRVFVLLVALPSHLCVIMLLVLLILNVFRTHVLMKFVGSVINRDLNYAITFLVT